MGRPPLEVADVIRAAGESFFECSQQWFTWLHLKVLKAIPKPDNEIASLYRLRLCR